MKFLKKALAIFLALAITSSLSACHPKDEVAISLDDYKLTSAMYSYFLVMADSEAKGIIADSGEYDISAANFNYYNQDIDGKSFEDYVKDVALENCKKFLAYEKLCGENGLVLSDEQISNAESMADENWNYYGYGAIFEQNGISFETYKKLLINSFKADLYFDSIYNEGGAKEVSTEDIQTTMDENYVAVYLLLKDYSSESEPDLDKIEEELEGFKTRLEKGEDYENVYNDFYDITSASTETDEEEEAEEGEDATPAPKDKYIQILGSEGTSDMVAFGKFDEVKAMEIGEVSVIADSDNKAYYVVVKKDINSDTYYRDEYLKSDILYLIKADEFEADILEYINPLKFTVNNYAMRQFKVKNIKDGTN